MTERGSPEPGRLGWEGPRSRSFSPSAGSRSDRRHHKILYGLGERFRIPALSARARLDNVMGLFALVNGVISIVIMSAAVVTGRALIFPSLGPTAFLLFAPTVPYLSPRNTICGHAIGAAAGYLAVVFGLTSGPGTTPGLARSEPPPCVARLTSGLMVAPGPAPPAGRPPDRLARDPHRAGGCWCSCWRCSTWWSGLRDQPPRHPLSCRNHHDRRADVRGSPSDPCPGPLSLSVAGGTHRGRRAAALLMT